MIKYTGKELKSRIDSISSESWQKVIDCANKVQRIEDKFDAFESIFLTAEFYEFSDNDK